MGGWGCVPGVARSRCPVFIALANRSIADSDTAQLGSPRTEHQPFSPLPFLNSVLVTLAVSVSRA